MAKRFLRVATEDRNIDFPENLLRDLLEENEFPQLRPVYAENVALWEERVMWYLDNRMDEWSKQLILYRYKDKMTMWQIFNIESMGFKHHRQVFRYLERRLHKMRKFEEVVWITYGEKKWLEKVDEYNKMIEERRNAWRNRPKWQGKRYKVDTLVFGEALQDYISGQITKGTFAKRCGVGQACLNKYMDAWCEDFIRDLQTGALVYETPKEKEKK